MSGYEAALALGVPASKAGLATALEATSACLGAHAVGPALEARVALLLEEALMNVAMHGGAPASPPRVELSLRLSPSAVELCLRDDGRPFDPRQAPAPRRAASLEAAVPGGVGVHLMRRFASELHYRREGRYNVLTMRVAR